MTATVYRWIPHSGRGDNAPVTKLHPAIAPSPQCNTCLGLDCEGGPVVPGVVFVESRPVGPHFSRVKASRCRKDLLLDLSHADLEVIVGAIILQAKARRRSHAVKVKGGKTAGNNARNNAGYRAETTLLVCPSIGFQNWFG